MSVLVDSSVWIAYFRGSRELSKLDFLIDKNLVVTNDLIGGSMMDHFPTTLLEPSVSVQIGHDNKVLLDPGRTRGQDG